MLRINLRSSASGAMVGCALGDAIGEIAFRYPARADLWRVVESYPELVYTDDTAMAIGLAQSLIACGRLDQQDLGRRFAANYKDEPWRGYGAGPPKIFNAASRSGQSCVEIARQLYDGRGSYGNGAAMRVAPIGIVYPDGPTLLEAARRSAQVTHAHHVGQDGAAIQALAVGIATRHALDGQRLNSNETAQHLVEAAETPAIRRKMAIVADLLANDAAPEMVADAVGRGIAMDESMPFAIYAFLRTPSDFRAAIECAVLNGGDRDTLGAMTGAITGAYLGIDALPFGWRSKVENGAYLEQLGADLAEMFLRRCKSSASR